MVSEPIYFMDSLALIFDVVFLLHESKRDKARWKIYAHSLTSFDEHELNIFFIDSRI